MVVCLSTYLSDLMQFLSQPIIIDVDQIECLYLIDRQVNFR